MDSGSSQVFQREEGFYRSLLLKWVGRGEIQSSIIYCNLIQFIQPNSNPFNPARSDSTESIPGRMEVVKMIEV